MSSGEPVTWATSVMRHGDDFNRCRESEIDNAEWKVAHDVAPVLDVDSWPALGRLCYREYGRVDAG